MLVAALLSLRNLMILLRRTVWWLRSEHSADFPGRDPRRRSKGGCISVWSVGNVRSFSVRRLLLKLRNCREAPWRRLTCPVLRAALLSLRNLMILLRRTA